MTIDDVIHEIAAEAGHDSRHAIFSPESALDPHRRPVNQEPVSVHFVEPGHRSTLQVCAVARSKNEDSARLADVATDLQIANPQANVVVDRDKASALGVTPQEVEDALYSAYGQRLVSPIYTSNNEYWVVSPGPESLPERSRHAFGALHPLFLRPTRSAQRRLKIYHGRRAPHRQPHRPASFGYALVQFGARSRARPGRE